MENEINLYIEYTHPLSDDEFNEFWDEIIDFIESYNLYAGGGGDNKYLEWCIDYSESSLDREIIIDKLSEYLKKCGKIVQNFRIE